MVADATAIRSGSGEVGVERVLSQPGAPRRSDEHVGREETAMVQRARVQVRKATSDVGGDGEQTIRPSERLGRWGVGRRGRW